MLAVKIHSCSEARAGVIISRVDPNGRSQDITIGIPSNHQPCTPIGEVDGNYGLDNGLDNDEYEGIVLRL
ncbi:hypothetical protein RSAG8_13819, partial [Rhizoctonia solani AG-8 WAC10335]